MLDDGVWGKPAGDVDARALLTRDVGCGVLIGTGPQCLSPFAHMAHAFQGARYVRHEYLCLCGGHGVLGG
jgi:hypothetical protein